MFVARSMNYGENVHSTSRKWLASFKAEFFFIEKKNYLLVYRISQHIVNITNMIMRSGYVTQIAIRYGSNHVQVNFRLQAGTKFELALLTSPNLPCN